MKRSFFERLSGHSATNDAFDAFDEELQEPPARTNEKPRSKTHAPAIHASVQGDDSSQNEGQLPVDLLQTTNDILIRAFVAGVRPDELGISISRDMVEISGSRAEREQTADPDFFTRELFWGSFSRRIILPQEIDVESSSASAKDGLLTIILPKLDKARQTKLKVKVG